MLIVGLTGGIGSGKSTVAKLFAQLGITVIDADLVARDVVKPGEAALKQIVEKFGKSVLDKNEALDRKKLREIIFNDAQKRQWLEKLLHPLIRAEMKRRIANLSASYCILMIPLLLEATEPYHLVNRILVVDTSEKLQIERTLERDKLSAEEVEAVMKTQATRAQRLKLADDVINNDSDLNELKAQVKRLHERYVILASQTS